MESIEFAGKPIGEGTRQLSNGSKPPMPVIWRSSGRVWPRSRGRDFDLEVRKRFGQSLLKGRPLISTIGEELFQEGKHPEQGRENKHACVAVLNIGRMYDRMKQEP